MKGRLEKGRRQRYFCNIGICVVSIFIIAALTWRIQCSISYYDETLNIYISYMTAALGQRHLVENGYIFSMGDVFNLPFVYLFWCITGGTEGLLLFIRFVYLGFNLLLSFIFWKVFGKFCGKKAMFLFGLILITFFPGGMYTVSYDTVALFFSLLGGILLLGAELRGNERNDVYRFFAGVCHACMTYAYPLMAGVILALLIGVTIYHLCSDHMKGKRLLCYWRPYFLGGMTVFAIFCMYTVHVGWENVFLFNKETVQSNLSGREISELTTVAESTRDTVASMVQETEPGVDTVKQTVPALKYDPPAVILLRRIVKQTLELLNYMWIQQKATLGITLLMLVQWGIGVVKKGKWRLVLIPEILAIAFFMHRNVTCFGGTTMYAYCCLWAPFLFLYLKSEERKWGVRMMLVLGLISLASFFAIGFTSVRTDKAHMGLYCGAICTFLFMIMLAKEEFYAGVPLSIAVVLLVAICNVGMSYIDHFQGADIKDCIYRMQKGFYKGMMTWEQDIQYEALKTCLDQEKFDENAIISMSNYNYYAACLDGNLRAAEGNVNLLYYEELLQSGETGEYVFSHKYWPEVILIDKNDMGNYACIKEQILDIYYSLVLSKYDYYLYIKDS